MFACVCVSVRVCVCVGECVNECVVACMCTSARVYMNTCTICIRDIPNSAKFSYSKVVNTNVTLRVYLMSVFVCVCV